MSRVLLVAGALVPEREREYLAPERVPGRLARRLMRAQRTVERFDAQWSDGAAHVAWLAHAFAAPGDPPAQAPFALKTTLTSAGSETTGAAVWFCEPVHLSLEPERTVLMPIDAPPLNEQEAAELFGEAAAAARDHGAELRRVQGRWYLLTDPPWSLWTAALPAVLGASVEHRLPRGTHAAQWRRLLNEVQMRWHASRSHREREARRQPAANALWLHGGGQWHALAASRFAAIETDDPVVRGWQQAAATGSGTVDRLTTWPHLFEPYWRRDWGAWEAGWSRLDTEVESLQRSATATRERRLHLVACGRRDAVRFVLDDGIGLLPWRRRTLAECLLEPGA